MKKYYFKYSKSYFTSYTSFSNKQYRALSFPRTIGKKQVTQTLQTYIDDVKHQIKKLQKTISRILKKDRPQDVKLYAELCKDETRLNFILKKLQKAKIVLETPIINFFKTPERNKFEWIEPKHISSLSACVVCGVGICDVKYFRITIHFKRIYICPFCVQMLGDQALQEVKKIPKQTRDEYRTEKFVRDL